MQRSEIEKRVAGFDQWHYEFDLDGVKTPIFDQSHANRHRQREPYMIRPLLDAAGGTLHGKRVLDLGCNAGYWSLKMIEAGADYVYGIDGRQMHIDQARLVFEVNNVEPGRYEFVEGNLFIHDYGDKPFDVVLCLGLLYHVAQPVHLFDLIARLNSDLLLIDTTLSLLPWSAFQLRSESIADPRASAEFSFVLAPTRQAVVDLAKGVGYQVRTLRPEFGDWTGARDYRGLRRRAFLCAKESNLSFVADERVPPRRVAMTLAAERLRRRGNRRQRQLEHFQK